MPTSLKLTAALLVALLETGCAPISAIQTSDAPDSLCGALRGRSSLLDGQLSSMRSQEEAEVDRVYHNIPGVKIDSVTVPEMDAMAGRIRADWRQREQIISAKLAANASRMRGASCRRLDQTAS